MELRMLVEMDRERLGTSQAERKGSPRRSHVPPATRKREEGGSKLFHHGLKQLEPEKSDAFGESNGPPRQVKLSLSFGHKYHVGNRESEWRLPRPRHTISRSIPGREGWLLRVNCKGKKNLAR